MWKPRRLTTLWASTACHRDSFTFFFLPYQSLHLVCLSPPFSPTPASIYLNLFVVSSFSCLFFPSLYTYLAKMPYYCKILIISHLLPRLFLILPFLFILFLLLLLLHLLFLHHHHRHHFLRLLFHIFILFKLTPFPFPSLHFPHLANDCARNNGIRHAVVKQGCTATL
jgi:hypothetical protein